MIAMEFAKPKICLAMVLVKMKDILLVMVNALIFFILNHNFAMANVRIISYHVRVNVYTDQEQFLVMDCAKMCKLCSNVMESVRTSHCHAMVAVSMKIK